MKRILIFVLILTLVLALASCQETGETSTSSTTSSQITSTTSTTTKKPTSGSTTTSSTTTTTTTVNGSTTPDPDEDHVYKDFTSSEKEILMQIFDISSFPFIPNDDYGFETYTNDDEIGVNFYAWDNTQAEFNAYLNKFSSYTLTDISDGDWGNTWYTYASSNGSYFVDISYYDADGGWVTDVYIYFFTGGSDDNTPDNDGYTHTDFTSSDKALFDRYIGAQIPFAPCDEYYIEGYYDTYDYENGLNYYTIGNTQADYNAYLAKFSSWELDEIYQDEYGYTWYRYIKGDVVVDVTYYEYYGEYYIDVFVYSDLSSDDEGNTGTGGSGGGSSDSSVDIITNEGQGLPTSSKGFFDVDFNAAEYVKNVTDQGYYLDGCPTTGSPAVLVIPVEFSDCRASSKGYTTDALENAFCKNGRTDYYSVYDYYYISSYGKLTLDITVLDEWFCPQYSSSYYYNATYEYYDEEVAIGDQLILDEALAYLAGTMDLSEFDSDNNGIIDSVVLINTLDIGEEDFYWAYRYWNIYTDDDGYYYEYDGVSANDYLWASYQFLYESYTDSGDTVYTDNSVMNTYTYIHEFGHILGLDDYYDTSYTGEPLSGCDIMDSMLGDHNAYSKFNLGWITSSRLVTTSGSITLTLEDFSKNGDTIIIANNWSSNLGAYQEYYILVYYTNNGLNSGDAGYFSRDGIVVYHVNASLYKEEIDGEIFYDVYNNNTDPSDQYGTEDNLIEYVKSADGNFTYVVGDTLPQNVIDDNGDVLGYSFTIDSLTDDYATITFTAK